MGAPSSSPPLSRAHASCAIYYAVLESKKQEEEAELGMLVLVSARTLFEDNCLLGELVGCVPGRWMIRRTTIR